MDWRKYRKRRKILPRKRFKMDGDKVKTLGVWLSTDPEIMLKANYEEKITKFKASLGCWELRKFSLLGKITVLKSLLVSQLTYILSPLPTNRCAIDVVNILFFKVLWDGKGDKIKRDIMISEHEDGGLKMIDMTLYPSLETKAEWKLFFNVQLRDLVGDIIFKGNLHRKDILYLTSRYRMFSCKNFFSNLVKYYLQDNICSKKQLLS